MARKSKSAPQPAEPEFESQEIPDEEPARVLEPEPESNGKGMSKTEATRQALAAGLESPKAAVAFIKSRFGIDMGTQHFSATKGLLKKKGGITVKVKGKPGRKPKADGQPAEAQSVPAAAPGIPANGEADLLHALEAIKPLVASLGAEKLKRIVDLLG